MTITEINEALMLPSDDDSLEPFRETLPNPVWSQLQNNMRRITTRQYDVQSFSMTVALALRGGEVATGGTC